MKIQSLLLLLVTLLFPLQAYAQTGSEIVLKDVKITLENEDTGSVDINIQFSAKSYPIKTQIVENPTRLVFDIEGLVLGRGRNEQLNSKLFKQARIGVHRDKTRIVFDSNKKDLNNISENKAASGIVFTISNSKIESPATSEKEAAEAPKEEAKKDVTPEPTAVATATPVKEVEEKVAKKEATPSLTPTPTPTIAPTETPTVKPSETPVPEKSVEVVPSITPDLKPTPTPVETSAKEAKTLSDLANQDKSKEKIVETIKADKTEDLTIPSTPPAIDVGSPVENESIKDVANKLKSQIGGALATSTGAAKSSDSSKGDDSSIIIKSIVFQTTTEKMQSSMVISTTAPISYSINQISKNNYEVVIPTTKLKGEYLKLPQFPPDSFKGFVYFVANDDLTGTRIQIETEDNVKLIPYVAMGKLWIRAE